MVVDVTDPTKPTFLIFGRTSSDIGFTPEFSKGEVFSRMEGVTKTFLAARGQRKSEGRSLRVISLESVSFTLVDNTTAEDTILDSILSKLTEDEMRILKRFVLSQP